MNMCTSLLKVGDELIQMCHRLNLFYKKLNVIQESLSIVIADQIHVDSMSMHQREGQLILQPTKKDKG